MPVFEFVMLAVFVLSSGLFFNERFRENYLAVGLAGLIALLSSYFVFETLWDRFPAATPISSPRTQLPPNPAPQLPPVTSTTTAPLSSDRERALKPKDTFAECSQCPEMVVVGAGNFSMGSNNGDSDEKPPHPVTILQPFAVGKFEVTFDEWDACVAQGGCTRKPDDRSWGRGRRPVIDVSWDDAKQYVGWLAKLTGKPYRLLTEAEWEYAARAGTTTTYSWGNDIGTGNANCYSCGSQWDNKQTAPVGSFKPNAFGLYDMHGNVLELVEDCYHDSYAGAPAGGTVWAASCTESRRVVRGGSWNNNPRNLRAANRNRNNTTNRNNNVGFRVASTLFRRSRRDHGLAGRALSVQGRS
jgi:formylglycine-generating enzyme required for sulfatase activity